MEDFKPRLFRPRLTVALLLAVFFFYCVTIISIKYSRALSEVRLLKEEVSQAKQYERDCWGAMYEHIMEADGKGWHKHKPEEGK